MNVYFEEDEIGRHKVLEQPNGIKIRLLKEPSAWYLDKQKKNAAAAAEKKAKADAVRAREKLISAKMREMAEAELIAEGKIEAEK